MADVRSLLRQQRAARRIEHPHAAYSDAGKLLCTVCHEHVKTESLWDGHVRGAGHQQRLQSRQADEAGKANGAGAATQSSHKRKLDVDGGDGDGDQDMGDAVEEESVRKKRSRPDMTSSLDTAGAKEPSTPAPPLLRRASGAPVQGVEIQIPSRPATPVATRDGSIGSGTATSVASTPKFAPSGRSPLIPQDPTGATATTTTTAAVTPSSASTQQQQPTTVDEDEWAAFEAEMVAPAPAPDAVISAPAMTAAEAAAKEEQERRRAQEEDGAELDDEREEAARALEAEFEEMEELEGRVRRLKERREALRQRGGPAPAPAAGVAAVVGAGGGKGLADGKENANGGVVGGEEESEDDEEDEDDWAGFRFRA